MLLLLGFVFFVAITMMRGSKFMDVSQHPAAFQQACHGGGKGRNFAAWLCGAWPRPVEKQSR